MSEEKLIPLDEVLRHASLTRNLIHAWERRYGLKPAARAPNGRRFYTAEQAERLRLLKRAADAGWRIGELVELSDDALAAMAAADEREQDVGEIIDAASALDTDRLAALIRVRKRAEGTRGWLFATVIPLLRRVGDLWQQSRLPIAAEHLVSLALKRVLLESLEEAVVDDTAPRAIATTFEGELHELGAASAALLARLEGVDARYLGPCLPIGEIAAAASRLNASHVMISCITLDRAVAEAQLVKLRALMPQGICLVVGGAVDPHASDLEGLVRAGGLAELPDILATSRSGQSKIINEP